MTNHITQIDTRHGTANQYSFSHGNCLPYTGVPFGMNYFAPQTTDQKGSWWFHPEDHTFQGYRLTHQPSPWMGDFSHVLMTPVGETFSELSLFHTQSSYRPSEATFLPYALKIHQLRYNITSSLVPSRYGGILEIDYDAQNQAGFLVTLDGYLAHEQLNAHELRVEFSNYSDCEDKSLTFFMHFHFENAISIIKEHEQESQRFLWIQFESTKTQTIHFGTSFISRAQAKLNLTRELDLTLADFYEAAKMVWQSYFDRIEVEHTDPEQTKTFYHTLYRMFLFPQTFYEYDETNQAIHYDTFNQTVKPGVLYTNNGFWDTYKTVFPFFSLIAKEAYEEMLEGFLNSYRDTGFLPKWLSPDERGMMPGTLIDAVIADAAMKNIRLDLLPEFFEGMKKSASVQSEKANYGRQGTLDYLEYGYVPNDYHESVNHTLDYAYSDFCISQVAGILGDTTAQNQYQAQAKNYRHLFDPETGFMRSKDRNGTFREEFSSIRWGKDYAEGSAWQSSFAVYQDFKGLIDLYGSAEAFSEKLIALCNQAPRFDVAGYNFEIHEMSEMAAIEFGQVAISNQPSFHLPYLFAYAGKPEMAQPMIKHLMTECFDATSHGYPGDEDNGSMSGWYVFSSLGFYPVTPGSNEFVIGMPLVKHAVLHLSNGETLTINATPNQVQHVFIDHIKYNKQRHHKTFFTYDQLMQGGTIDYTLGIVPHPRAYAANELPFSLSN